MTALYSFFPPINRLMNNYCVDGRIKLQGGIFFLKGCGTINLKFIYLFSN
jgi:hypothetical protein